MTIAMWILNILLAVAFLAAGGMHAFRSREQLTASGMGWAGDSSAGMVKAIGWLEILGVLGLILPIATGIATILTPLAAIGLAIVMAGAMATHVRRKEPYIAALVLFILAVASAVVGFLAI